MACVQKGPDFNVLLPKEWFVGSSLTSRFASALTLSSKHSGVHSFSIVARMLKDPELGPGVASALPPMPHGGDQGTEEDAGRAFPMTEVLEKRGELIRKYAEQWVVNTHDKTEVQSKVDELLFLMTLLYGVTGFQEGKSFKADFFT